MRADRIADCSLQFFVSYPRLNQTGYLCFKGSAHLLFVLGRKCRVGEKCSGTAKKVIKNPNGVGQTLLFANRFE